MTEVQNAAETQHQYSRIGGWLILIAIGLIITPIRIFITVATDLLPVFAGDAWSILTTPGTESYHSLWAPLLLFELVGNLFFAAYAIVLAVVFFKRKKFVPKLVIIFLITNLIFVATDYFAADLIPFIASQNDPDSLKELIRTFIGCVIWVPYFFVSKRVKGTFVE